MCLLCTHVPLSRFVTKSDRAAQSMNVNDNKWMQRALDLARKAQAQGEVPVGALIVMDDAILGEGWNQPVGTHDPTAHAEIVALRAAARQVGNYRLNGATLYVTLEPCAMCAGAILHARLKCVVFGAYDARAGAAGSRLAVLQSPHALHDIEVRGGVLHEPCGQLLKDFFATRRRRPDKAHKLGGRFNSISGEG